MKSYKVTLEITDIKAENNEDAKEAFWEIVMEDQHSLSLNVTEV